jgi:hypothetical protein
MHVAVTRFTLTLVKSVCSVSTVEDYCSA